MLIYQPEGQGAQRLVSEEKEKMAIMEQVKVALLAITDPEDGRPVFDTIYLKEQLFNGPFIEHMPEMIAVMRDYAYRGVYCTSAELDGEALLRTPALDWGPLVTTGTHRVKGMLAMAGPDIHSGDLGEASILDLAPTVGVLLGLPGQADYDGSILGKALVKKPDRSSSANNHNPQSGSPGEKAYSQEEEEAMRSKLQGLGYI